MLPSKTMTITTLLTDETTEALTNLSDEIRNAAPHVERIPVNPDWTLVRNATAETVLFASLEEQEQGLRNIIPLTFTPRETLHLAERGSVVIDEAWVLERRVTPTLNEALRKFQETPLSANPTWDHAITPNIPNQVISSHTYEEFVNARITGKPVHVYVVDSYQTTLIEDLNEETNEDEAHIRVRKTYKTLRLTVTGVSAPALKQSTWYAEGTHEETNETNTFYRISFADNTFTWSTSINTRNARTREWFL